MSIVVEARRIRNIDLGDSASEVTDFLNENIGDVVELEIDIRVESYVKATSATPDDGGVSIVLDPATELIDAIPDSRYIWCDTPGAFEDWFEGDRITINGSTTGQNTSRTIIAVISDQLLLLNTAWIDTETLVVGAFVYNSTLITGIEFFHNLVE